MVEFREIETPRTAIENLALWLGMRMGDFSGVSDITSEHSDVLACWLESIVVLGKAAGLSQDDFRPLMDAPGFSAAWEKYEP